MPTLHALTIELEEPLAENLCKAAEERGWTPESLVAECVAQHLEIAVRHRVLVEKFEAVDLALFTLVQFVGASTAGSDSADLWKICRYGRDKGKPR
jgi:hypothetical protein